MRKRYLTRAPQFKFAGHLTQGDALQTGESAGRVCRDVAIGTIHFGCEDSWQVRRGHGRELPPGRRSAL